MSVLEINYSFDSVPTVKAFVESRKRYKYIQGPLGCVPAGFEFLTPSGWKKIKNFEGKDLVAQWSPVTGSISFVQPLDFIKKPADDWLIFVDRTTDEFRKNRSNYSIRYFPFSPEHKVAGCRSRSISNSKLEVYHAYEVPKLEGRLYLPVNFKPDSYFSLGVPLEKTRLYAFLILYDRWVYSKDRLTIYLPRTYLLWRRKLFPSNEGLLERLKSILDDAGVSYSISDEGDDYVIDCKTIIPSSLLDKPFIYEQNLMQAVCDELFYWAKTYYTRKQRQYRYHSISLINKSALDFVQFAWQSVKGTCYLCSGCSSCSMPNTPHLHAQWIYLSPIIRCSRVFSVSDFEDEFGFSPEVSEDKYCFSVPSGFFLVRWRGQIFVSGNSGKSSGCVIHLLLSAIEQKPNENGERVTRYAIIRNTGKQLNDTTKVTIDEWIPPSIARWREGKFKYEISFGLDDGTVVKSEWLLRALDDPQQVRDLLSMELSGAWLNEGREIKWEIFSHLRGRIDRFPPKRKGGVTYPFIIIDSNPPDTEHWIYRFFEELPKEDPKLRELTAVFKQPSGLSPEAENIDNLPVGYYENLMVGQDKDWIKVHVHGEYGFTKAGKPVFSSYVDSLHYAGKELHPVKGLPIIIGMDFGLNPAAVFTQVLPIGKLLVLDELVSLEPTDLSSFIPSKVLPLIATKYLGFSILVIGDPAGRVRSQTDKRSCFMVLREFGLKGYPAWSNSINDRVRAVNLYLTRMVNGEPAFSLSSTCKMLRKALISEYRFKRLRVSGERYSDLPEKNLYSHVADALQYACLGYSPSTFSSTNIYRRRSMIYENKNYSFKDFT